MTFAFFYHGLFRGQTEKTFIRVDCRLIRMKFGSTSLVFSTIDKIEND